MRPLAEQIEDLHKSVDVALAGIIKILEKDGRELTELEKRDVSHLLLGYGLVSFGEGITRAVQKRREDRTKATV